MPEQSVPSQTDEVSLGDRMSALDVANIKLEEAEDKCRNIFGDGLAKTRLIASSDIENGTKHDVTTLFTVADLDRLMWAVHKAYEAQQAVLRAAGYGERR